MNYINQAISDNIPFSLLSFDYFYDDFEIMYYGKFGRLPN